MLTLAWFREIFKTEKEKELELLKIEEQKLKNENLTKEGEVISSYKQVPQLKPYITIKFVNNVLTVVLEDGTVMSKPNATGDDFNRVRESSSEEEILKVMLSQEQFRLKLGAIDLGEQILETISNIGVLAQVNDFEVNGNSAVLRGTGRTIPALLIERFAKVIEKVSGGDSGEDIDELLSQDDEYQGLKRFFLWCCLNPRAEVADKLYEFLEKNDMKITKQGFFVGLRNVLNVEGNNPELVDFITNAYNKIKAVWKKKPSDYEVVKFQGEYKFEKTKETSEAHNGEWIGNLEELYKNLSEMKENRFTDNHTKTFDIRIGQKVWMNPEDCSWSTADCAEEGLHFAGHTAPYVLCGDTTVFTLHNPMKVVGIGTEKGRCYEYLPFMTTNVKEASEIMRSGDFDFLQLDEQYAIDELEGLADKVMEGFSVEAKKYEFNLPTMSSKELANIVISLEEMKNSLSKRVVVLD